MQPPVPALQQLTPLRPPPRTPRAVARAVHDSIMGMVDMAEAPMSEGAKQKRWLLQDVTEVSHDLGPDLRVSWSLDSSDQSDQALSPLHVL